MKENITGAQFCQMIICAADALEANQQTINELNVFPVPDGDTGTNMTLTITTAAGEFRKKTYDELGVACDKAASALLRGARGNSGVILSLLFRGMARSLKGKEIATTADFANAMCDGVDAAYKAVMKPAEGTILTVSRVATAAAAEYAQEGMDFEKMMQCAIDAGEDALAETIEQNPVLKRAGVVDAGGKGYLVILDAMLACLQGRAVAAVKAAAPKKKVKEKSAFEVFDTSEITFAYDTVFIVSKNENSKPLDTFRAYLETIGDSIVISEDDEMFKVHVHTNIPGEALNKAADYGTLEIAKIENMRTQHDELMEGDDDEYDEAEETEIVEADPEKRYGFVAVCAGEGLAQVFRELGVDRIVTGGQTMNPSTEDILKEIMQTPAETVFVLPNNKNIIMAAQQCIPIAKKKVVVIPTATVPQGISALLNLDTHAEEQDIVDTFTEVISNVHTAQITYAARNSDFDGYEIHEGEYLGLLDGGLVGSYTESSELVSKLCEKLTAIDPEFISVYYGEDVTEADAQVVADQLAEAMPDAEISVVNGGQPVYYYMISAE